jgi:hypothetical protein
VFVLQVLCADWIQRAGIVSGGADNQMQIHTIDNTE